MLPSLVRDEIKDARVLAALGASKMDPLSEDDAVFASVSTTRTVALVLLKESVEAPLLTLFFPNNSRCVAA